MKMSDWATDSGHWYTREGEPKYTLIGKNGKVRNTTLRDARELLLVPSVTTIIREASAPGLERWKREQLLLAALTTTRNEGEDEKAWIKRINESGRAEAEQAAARGSEIHGAIEAFVSNRTVRHGMEAWVGAAMVELDRLNSGIWFEERSFASRLGYGGRIDLHSEEWVLDIKSKETIKDVELYDENVMQLAAYRRGLGKPDARCGCLFISRITPECVLLEANEAQLDRALYMFDHLHGYWVNKTGYMPGWL
jgi:hypothetical protein